MARPGPHQEPPERIREAIDRWVPEVRYLLRCAELLVAIVDARSPEDEVAQIDAARADRHFAAGADLVRYLARPNVNPAKRKPLATRKGRPPNDADEIDDREALEAAAAAGTRRVADDDDEDADVG